MRQVTMFVCFAMFINGVDTMLKHLGPWQHMTEGALVSVFCCWVLYVLEKKDATKR